MIQLSLSDEEPDRDRATSLPEVIRSARRGRLVSIQNMREMSITDECPDVDCCARRGLAYQVDVFAGVQTDLPVGYQGNRRLVYLRPISAAC